MRVAWPAHLQDEAVGGHEVRVKETIGLGRRLCVARQLRRRHRYMWTYIQSETERERGKHKGQHKSVVGGLKER